MSCEKGNFHLIHLHEGQILHKVQMFRKTANSKLENFTGRSGSLCYAGNTRRTRGDAVKIRVPEPPLKREYNLSVRLTPVKHQALKQLARQMNVSLSHLVRHFLMQAVEYYNIDRVRGKTN